MLGQELNNPKHLEISKSSFYAQEFDEKRLKQLLEERDKTIRQLSKRIARLENAQKKAATKLNAQKMINSGSEQYNSLLVQEVGKNKQLKEIISFLTSRLNLLLQDLMNENSFTDQSTELRLLLGEIKTQNNLSVSFNIFHYQLDESLSLTNDYAKMFELIEGSFKNFKAKSVNLKEQANSLSQRLELSMKQIQNLKIKLQSNDEVNYLLAQLKQERKQRQKLRALLDKSQLQKNELINKINTSNKSEIKIKSKQELMQFAIELSYRIKDLEKQKSDLLLSCKREKEIEYEKYQNLLKRVRVLKLGKSRSSE